MFTKKQAEMLGKIYVLIKEFDDIPKGRYERQCIQCGEKMTVSNICGTHCKCLTCDFEFNACMPFLKKTLNLP